VKDAGHIEKQTQHDIDKQVFTRTALKKYSEWRQDNGDYY
jgi:hypothetical protein